MSEQIISNQWTCECTTSNPLRKRCCVGCGRKIQQDFLDKIYKEEISIQNIYFKRLGREKEIRKLKKVGQLLTKCQILAVLFLIVALVACNAVRFNYFSEGISTFADDYIDKRNERIESEYAVLSQDFEYIKSNIGQISLVWTNVCKSLKDIMDGIAEDKKQISINEEKVNYIEEKIMEVKKYVAGKSR